MQSLRTAVATLLASPVPIGGEREQRLIAGAMQSAERAETFVQRRLAFARRRPLQPVTVDLATLVVGMGEFTASTTGPQIEVLVEAPAGLPPMQADPNQLEMALLSLGFGTNLELWLPQSAAPPEATRPVSAIAQPAGSQGRALLVDDEETGADEHDRLSGTDLARTGRAARPDPPVLLGPGYAERKGSDPDLPRLTKPFRKDELAACLAQIAAIRRPVG